MPRLSQLITGILAFGALLIAVPPVHAQDFRVLRDTREVNPDVKPALAPLAVTPTVRVLLAGDSWAQYMWDDGSHNDLFDKFGHQDKTALSRSLDSDPGAGYVGPEYAISGSEARQWTNTASYPWIANLRTALLANPDVEVVVLSVGGNDMLAGKSDGGWYKDMDLDVPGSEDAVLSLLEQNTAAVVDSILAVRPDVEVLLSSYDYPNFNVGFWCFLYACPKRNDLSRDPNNDLITDAELNDMMLRIETRRIDWVNAQPRMHYDHAMGLMHYFYGDGVSAARTLPYPGQTPPDYLPFPAGNPLRPSLRSTFRRPSGIDADPIHLDYEGYQYKIAAEVGTFFFPRFRGEVTETFFSAGGSNDGWTDGVTVSTDGLRAGSTVNGPARAIISFDTASIPDGAVITGASLYLHRREAAGTNPFTSGALGLPLVDVATGSFGGPAVEAGDATAAATVTDVGTAVGSARLNGYSVRLELDPAALAAINDAGLTQFRLGFPAGNGVENHVTFRDGDAGVPLASGIPSLAEYMGNYAPFLDVRYDATTGIGDDLLAEGTRLLLPNTPNPFRWSTTIPFALPEAGRVSLDVFDLSGRRVRVLQDGVFPEGTHAAIWDGRDDRGVRLSAGIYFARLRVGAHEARTRITLLGK